MPEDKPIRSLTERMQAESANSVLVGIADIKLGRAPQVLKTNLGSCIAVCLYCAEKGVGGMLHFMLDYPLPKEREGFKKGKYAESGIPELVTQMGHRFGVGPGQLTAKIFGGARLLPTVTRNIGLDNDAAARRVLREMGIRVIAAKTGGEKGYKIDFDLATGKVKCQIFDEAVVEY